MTKARKNDRPEDNIYKHGTYIGHDLKVIDHLGGSRKVDVYLCRSKELKRLVACKILLPGNISNDIVRDGLLREGEILKQLKHPNVIEEYGLYLEPLPRIVLEYLEGQDIETVFFGGNYESFDISDFVEIALQLCDALSYIHDKGFLHLDVKPDNIFYYEGQIKLIDFSLAREYSPDIPLVHRSGTINYMAPEQNLKKPLSYATDVFGMGVTFYQLLTGGKLPYKTVPQEDEEGIFDRISDYSLPVKLPSQINQAVSESLDAIALQAIHPDIDKRIQTPAAFKAALLDAF